MTKASRKPSMRPDQAHPVAPTEMRYVKLGPKNRWESASLEEGRIYFGWENDPHDLAARGDWPGVREASLGLGQAPAAATTNVTEMQAFYELGSSCLWITFARGHLWWGFADEEIQTLPERLPDGRFHYRCIIGGWRRTDMAGEDLRIDRLSSSLTQVAGYRRTICKVADEAHLLSVLNAEPNDLAAIAQGHRDALSTSLEPLICALHWSDFELFVDLLLSRMGWRRVGRLGGVQADIDMLVELPATGQRMAVQVKSKIDAGTMRNWAEKLRTTSTADRLLVACHQPRPPIDHPDVELWDGPALARHAVDQGLSRWLIERTR